MKMGPLIGQLKGRISRRIISNNNHKSVLNRADGRPAIWQRRCYDHNCREPHIVVEKINYCHKNPVTRGLVALPDDWPWSSSRWYSGAGEVMLEIDGYEL
jgi:REP element-mobilizing transposase RayT